MNYKDSIQEEIISNNLETDEEALAFLNGVIKASGEFQDSNGLYEIIIKTTNYELLFIFNDYFKRIYKDGISIEYKTTEHKKRYYNGVIRGKCVYKILEDLNIYSFKDGKISKIHTFKPYVKTSEIAAFMQGLFIAEGNIYIPSAHSQEQGYHFECFVKDTNIIDGIVKMLKNLDIEVKLLSKEDYTVIYIKDSNAISDILALMNANNSVLYLNDLITSREIRNNINRQNNCYYANLEKSINANTAQLEAIQYLKERNCMNSLNEKQLEVVKCRLDYPNYTLEGIANLIGISKSGVNHRFQSIINLVDKLKREDGYNE